MNRISDFICSYYSYGQACPIDKMNDYQIMSTALEAIGLVALSYLCMQSCNKRFVPALEVMPTVTNQPTAATELQSIQPLRADQTNTLFQTFENHYCKQNLDKTCPSLREFEEHGPLLEDLLTKWTLDSNICFFEFLGFNIYDDWKREGGIKEDLIHFCSTYQQLCVKLANSVKKPITPRYFDALLRDFQVFSTKIPAHTQPQFAFLLKVLSQPRQAIALGHSCIGWFDRNDVLDGKSSRKSDVLAFLNFASQLYPKELGFICTTQKDSALSKKLNKAMQTMKINHTPTCTLTKVDRYLFISCVKFIVDYRLLKKELPLQRLIANLTLIDLYDFSGDTSWFHKMLREHLLKDFDQGVKACLAQLTTMKRGGVIAVDGAYATILSFVNSCRTQPIAPLEHIILKKLNQMRKRCQDPKAYAAYFSDMVHLYQTIHDIHFLKDITKDQLEGQCIPDSFIEVAFLPSIPDLATSEGPSNEVPLNGKLSMPFSPQSSSISQTDDLPVQRVKPKTHANKREIDEEKGKQLNISEICTTSDVERPEFPTRNVSGRNVLRLLLDHGFVMRGIEGSHYQMMHVITKIQTTVPYHKSLKPKTLSSIRKAFDTSQGFQSS